jgi:hypothetical protein
VSSDPYIRLNVEVYDPEALRNHYLYEQDVIEGERLENVSLSSPSESGAVESHYNSISPTPNGGHTPVQPEQVSASSASYSLIQSNQVVQALPPFEVTPLENELKALRDQSLLMKLFIQKIKFVPEKDPYKIFRRGVFACLFLTAAGAQFSFVSTLRKDAPDPVVAFNCVSFLAYHYEAIRCFAKNWSRKSDIEKTLIKRSTMEPLARGGIAISAIAIAVIAQSPVAFSIYHTDQVLPLGAFVIVWLGGTMLFTRSLDLLASKVSSLIRLYSTASNQELEAARVYLTKTLKRYRENIARKPTSNEVKEAGKILAGLRFIPNNDQNIVFHFMRSSLAISGNVPKGITTKRIGELVGILLGGSMHLASTMWAHDIAKMYIRDSEVIAFGASICFFSTFYLPISAISAQATSIARFARDLFRCKRKKTISERLRPYLTNTLRMLTLAANACVYCSSLSMFGHYFENEPARYYFVVTSSIAFFLQVNYAASKSVERFVKYWIHLKGTEEEKLLIEILSLVGKLKKHIQNSSHEDLLLFLASLPPDIQNKLMVDCTGGARYLFAAQVGVLNRLKAKSNNMQPA